MSLAGAGGQAVKTYSGGMRRRLDLAASLIGRPPVLFLDEPTTGLDPRTRNDLWALIEELVAEGTTVLLTTQYMEEAEHLADRIVVLDAGRDRRRRHRGRAQRPAGRQRAGNAGEPSTRPGEGRFADCRPWHHRAAPRIRISARSACRCKGGPARADRSRAGPRRHRHRAGGPGYSAALARRRLPRPHRPRAAPGGGPATTSPGGRPMTEFAAIRPPRPACRSPCGSPSATSRDDPAEPAADHPHPAAAVRVDPAAHDHPAAVPLRAGRRDPRYRASTTSTSSCRASSWRRS